MATKRFEPQVQLDNGLTIPALAGSGKVLTSDSSGNATWQTVSSSYHSELQNGVILSTDLALSTISINTGTGALTFTPAATGINPVWVNTSGGVLTPVTYGGAAVTPTASPPATTTYAVVGVEIDTTGAISTIKGTNTATQLNTGSLIASNSPAITSGKMRIADFAIWNNAGVFNFSDHTTIATQGTNWIDRRPWARGFHYTRSNPNATNYTTTTANPGTAISSDLSIRAECTGAPLEYSLLISGVRNTGVNSTTFVPWADGTIAPSGTWSVGTSSVIHWLANNNQFVYIRWPAMPAGGSLSAPASHLFTPAWYINAGTSTIDNGFASGVGTLFSVRENVTQNANNGII